MQYSLLVFEIVFSNQYSIMGVMYQRVSGWEKMGIVGVDGKTKAGSSCHQGTDSGTIGDKDVHKSQDRLRRSLVGVWHPTNSE